jgi:hypothetical protein
MPFRTLSRIALLTGLLLTFSSAARAEPAKDQAYSSGWHPSVKGFDLLASVGYGVATSRVGRLSIEPYGASFGLEGGYTFNRGVRIGFYGQYGLGRSRDSTYHPLRGDPFPVTADAAGVTAGASVGYDLALYMWGLRTPAQQALVLRYTLSFGLSWMQWDFGELPTRPLAGFSQDKDSVLGFHVAPGVCLLWRIKKLEAGIGFDYWIQVEDRIPPGVLTKLLLGVKL